MAIKDCKAPKGSHQGMSTILDIRHESEVLGKRKKKENESLKSHYDGKE